MAKQELFIVGVREGTARGVWENQTRERKQQTTHGQHTGLGHEKRGKWGRQKGPGEHMAAVAGLCGNESLRREAHELEV